MSEIPFNAPGCFGSALAFDPTNSYCKTCIFAEQCEPMHKNNLIALRAKLGIEHKEDPSPLIAKTERQSGNAGVSVKTQELLDKLDAGGFNIIENLKSGINPFAKATKFKFLAYTCELLLKLSKPIDRQMLQMAFMTRLNWSEQTAQHHIRLAFQALEHIGAVTNTDGAITLRRD